jgi:hypothetical protein
MSRAGRIFLLPSVAGLCYGPRPSTAFPATVKADDLSATTTDKSIFANNPDASGLTDMAGIQALRKLQVLPVPRASIPQT